MPVGSTPVPGLTSISRGYQGRRPCLVSRQRYAARDGTSDLSQKDCHHCFDSVEERGVLRRQSSETTNSLSASDRVRSILGIFSSGGLWVLETPWFESESQLVC